MTRDLDVPLKPFQGMISRLQTYQQPSKTVIWRPQALGLRNQKNDIPTALVSGGGVVIELLLMNTAAEVCDSTGSPPEPCLTQKF